MTPPDTLRLAEAHAVARLAPAPRLADRVPSPAAVHPWRICLVADRGLFRLGMAHLLARTGMVVAGEAAGRDDALEALRHNDVEVVLIDLKLSSMPAAELTRALRRFAPSLPIVALATPGAEDLLDAIAAGAWGYVSRDASPETIVAGIRRATTSDQVLVPRAQVVKLAARRRVAPPPDSAAGGLTTRELDVLRLLVEGHDNHAIAARLFISADTAKCHVSRILAKLGVRNRVQAAVTAVRLELVQ